jgi:eukaryotic-like serine/threonine-protein kinase
MTGDTTLGPARASADLVVHPGDLIKHFVVLVALGRGAAGLVVSAYDPSLDRKVAIKLVRAATDDTAELVREAQALARLSHPNVVTVYEVGTFGDHVYIAMEHLRGSTLDAWLAAEPRSVREIVAVFVAAGRGIAAAHGVGLVHCDVKPRNLMVLEDGGIRVVDFGLALAADDDHRRGVVGTPAYMAPEQARGEPVDARTDQYCFCVALHEAVYGTLPGAGKPLRAAPPWLARLIERGMDPDRERRFPGMAELLAELMLDRRARRRRAVVAAGFVAIAAAAIAPRLASERVEDPCPPPETEVVAVWNPARAATLGGWPRARAELDRYASALVAMRGQACRAARVEHTETESMLDLRRVCLDEHLRAMAAVVGVLSPSAADGRRALEAVTALPPVDECADTAWLLARVKPPTDPVRRAAVDAIRGLLAEAYAQFWVARYPEALVVAREAYRRAQAVDHLPVRADAAVGLGQILAYNGTAGVLEHLQDGVRLGLRSQNYEAAAAGWGMLIFQLGIARDRPDEAYAAAHHAVAMLEGLPGGERRLAGVLGRRGLLYSKHARFDEAEADLRRAVALRIKHAGPTHPDTAASTYYLGTVLTDRGKHVEAIAALSAARDLFRDHVSRVHNLAHLAAKDIAFNLRTLGRPVEALAALDEIEETVAEALGRDPFADRARIHDERGRVLTALGRHAEALVAARTALADAVAKLGEAHVDALAYRTRVAEALVATRAR